MDEKYRNLCHSKEIISKKYITQAQCTSSRGSEERSDDDGPSSEVTMTKSSSSRPRPTGGKAPAAKDQPRCSSLDHKKVVTVYSFVFDLPISQTSQCLHRAIIQVIDPQCSGSDLASPDETNQLVESSRVATQMCHQNRQDIAL